MVQATDGDRIREVARTERDVRNLRWSADGESLLFLERPDGYEVPNLYRIDLRTGRISKAVEGAGSDLDIAPDGRTAIFLRLPQPRGSDEAAILARDLETGAERQVATLPQKWDVRTLALSPDGRQVAFVHQNRETDARGLNVVQVETGAMREIYSVEHPRALHKRHGSPTWTPDGSHLLVYRFTWGQEEDSDELLAVPVDGDEPISVTDWNNRRWPAVHPDGRRLAFTGGEMRTELWVLENVTEAVEAAISGTN